MNDLDSKFKKILLILSGIIGVFFLVAVGTLFFHARGMFANDTTPEPEAPESNQVETPPVEPEGYELRMNATAYQIELFEELMAAHDQFGESGTDEALHAYASTIVRNFVADFFTLSNKDSRADVGGAQFFSNDVVNSFTTAAMDDFYLYLGRHIETYGREAMPTIESTVITHVEFGARPIEVEEEEAQTNEEVDIWEIIEPEEPVEVEYERTIVVYVEWTFGQTTLPYIDQFQTSARFVLMEVENEGIRIFQIEMIEEECEYDMWGQCIVEPEGSTYIE